VGLKRDSIAPQVPANSVNEDSNDFGSVSDTSVRSDDGVNVTDIRLVSVYGKAYCIELGALGAGRGISVYWLDVEQNIACVKTHCPKSFRMHPNDPDNYMVCVIDNLLCVVTRRKKLCMFVDLHDLFLDHGQTIICTICEKMDVRNEPLFSETSEATFLPPYYMIDTEERGNLWPLSLNLERMGQSFPMSQNGVPFFLRRHASREVAHSIVLNRFHNLLAGSFPGTSSPNAALYISQRNAWMESLAGIYARDENAHTWDQQVSYSLLYKCILLPTEADFNRSYRSPSLTAYNEAESVMPPALPSDTTVTQTDIVERVLLPQADEALFLSDSAKLRFLQGIIVDFMGTLENAIREFSPPSMKGRIWLCPAMECLLWALMWRLGDGEELVSYLDHRLDDRKAIAKEIEAISEGKDIEEGLETLYSFDSVIAEMLVMLLANVDFGTNDENNDGERKPSYETREKVMSRVIDILCACKQHRAAAKYMLEVARVIDAMTLCEQVMAKSLREAGNSEEDDDDEDEPDSFASKGMESADFFEAAIESARRIEGIDERCKLMHRVHNFLEDWDPECFKKSNRLPSERKEEKRRRSWGMGQKNGWHPPPVESRRSSFSTASFSSVIQSNLAHAYPHFPDDLFGGLKSEHAISLRKMFGYRIAGGPFGGAMASTAFRGLSKDIASELAALAED